MMASDRSYLEAYTSRSTFFRLLGEAGKTLADAYCQADAENQADIVKLISEALMHSLVEHHGYTPAELRFSVAVPA